MTIPSTVRPAIDPHLSPSPRPRTGGRPAWGTEEEWTFRPRHLYGAGYLVLAAAIWAALGIICGRVYEYRSSHAEAEQLRAEAERDRNYWRGLKAMETKVIEEHLDATRENHMAAREHARALLEIEKWGRRTTTSLTR